MPCSRRDTLWWHRESEPSNRDPRVSCRVAQYSFSKIVSPVVIFHLLAGCHEPNCILYYFPSDHIFCVDKLLYARQPRHGSLCTSREIAEHTQVPLFVLDSLGEHLYLLSQRLSIIMTETISFTYEITAYHFTPLIVFM